MLPSKKIFVGASAIVSGVLLEVILGFAINRSMSELYTSGREVSDAMEMDRLLEFIASQTSLGLNAMTLGLVFVLCGTALLLAGVYQCAKSVERLRAEQAQRDG